MPVTAYPAGPATDIVRVLVQDHERILQLFAAFQQLRDNGSDDEKELLVERACTELVIHAEIEEQLLYPELRRVFTEHDLLDEAKVEHSLSRQLVAELEVMEAGDDLYDAKFAVLGQYVAHHIAREQDEVFPRMLEMSDSFRGIHDELLQRRHDLRSEFGMPDEEYEEEDESRSQQPAGPA